MPPSTASGGISREWCRGQGERNSINLSVTIGLTNLPDMTSLAASYHMQNAVIFCIKVRKRGPGGIESNNSATVLIKIKTSINFFKTSIPACSTATPDMTSPGTSGPQLSKFEKTAQNDLGKDHEILRTYRGQ